ncbi:hypothetical protein ACH5RR_008370 [Cinchona calisaya]|uniref:Uncharacterized protein n=1 Tax=Cinchona calisaya TaxID=153742 RepID=A0ABD3ABV9_9GENT
MSSSNGNQQQPSVVHNPVARAYNRRDDDVHCLCLERQYLCRTTFPAFELGSKRQINLKITGPKDCSQELTITIPKNDMPEAAGWVVFFDVKLRVRYRLVLNRYMSWILPGKNWKKANLYCPNVKVWFPPDGTRGIMVGETIWCWSSFLFKGL